VVINGQSQISHCINGILGVAVGDALGVPVEFESRETLHDQPAGTWSDDTSMTLCLLDSLSLDLNYNDIMEKFQSWVNEAGRA